MPIKKKTFFFFFFLGVTFHKNFCKLYFLLVLSLIGCFLPIFGCVFFHPLSSTLYLFFPLLALCQFWLLLFIHFHPLFTCSLPYWLSASFGCFFSSTFIHSLFVLSLFGFLSILAGFFIHFHPLFTCSFPYWLSANFDCFSFIHFHPLSSTLWGSGKGLELGTWPCVCVHIRAGSFLALF